MNAKNKFLRWSNMLALILVLVTTFAVAGPVPAAAAAVPDSIMVCTTNATSTFTLTTKTGYISLPDGNTTFMWGFSTDNNDYQYPGPILCVKEGDTVTIVLHNTFAEEVSLIFPGQINVLANGLPSQPTGNSLAQAAAPGGTITYSFVAGKPGTFLYESGSNTGIQINMGMFGAIVVRPAAHPDWAYNLATTQFNPNAEFINIMSEVDPALHSAVEQGLPYDMNNFLPRYWLINGRGFPDTVAPNNAYWLPTQPYSALVHIKEWDAASNPLPALIRYINVAYEINHFHPHGFNGRLIGRDGNPLVGPASQDISFEKFSIPLGSGQTWDSLISWKNVDAFNPSTNPVPVIVPPETDITIGEFFSGSPYLGSQEVLPPGTVTKNQCGEYYHIAHNHDLFRITSWGITMTGQATYTRVDPLNGCP